MLFQGHLGLGCKRYRRRTGHFQSMFISRSLCRTVLRPVLNARSKIGIAAGHKAFCEHSANWDYCRVCPRGFMDRSHSGIFGFYTLFSQGPQPIRNPIRTTFGRRARHREFPIAHEIVGGKWHRSSHFVVLHVALRLPPKFWICNVPRSQRRDSVAKVKRAAPLTKHRDRR